MASSKKGYLSLSKVDEKNRHKVAKYGRHFIWFYPDMKDPPGKKFYKTIEFEKPNVHVVPRDDGSRENIYVAGKSGSGKSYWTGKHAEQYAMMYPDNIIYLISGIDEDRAYDSNDNIVRLDIDEITQDPIENLKELRDSLVIFDDVEMLNTKQVKAINALQKSIYTRGRHYNISAITIRHNITDYKDTRLILHELNQITFYPVQGCTSQIEGYLARYAGFDKSIIAKILALDSRWITIVYTWQVPIVITENLCSLVTSL